MQIKNVEIMVSLQDILIQLKSELSVRGIDLLKDIRPSGNNIQVTCPYHNGGHEHKPSGGIHCDTGIFHCFACDTTVGLDEFVSNCFGYNDSGAYGWAWIIQNFVTLEKGEGRIVNVKLGNRRSSSADTDSSATFVSEEELDKYRYYHSYWEKRGIKEDWLIELFDLGYDKATKCITMPNHNKDGDCEFVAKRSVKTKFFNYPADVSKMCYGIYQLYQLEEFPREVWITESMIDALRLWQTGRFAVALNGLGNDRQFRELTEMPNRCFILATDMDERGQEARDRIKKNVKHKFFKEAIIPHKDIGECTDDEIEEIEVII